MFLKISAEAGDFLNIFLRFLGSPGSFSYKNCSYTKTCSSTVKKILPACLEKTTRTKNKTRKTRKRITKLFFFCDTSFLIFFLYFEIFLPSPFIILWLFFWFCCYRSFWNFILFSRFSLYLAFDVLIYLLDIHGICIFIYQLHLRIFLISHL